MKLKKFSSEILWILLSMILLIAGVSILSHAASARPRRIAPAGAYAPDGVGRWDTAVTQDNIAKTICVAGYTSVIRTGGGKEFGAITAAIKKEVYQRDGKTPDGLGAGKSHCCEIDHYFPLNSGGANVIGNLWAESWDHPYGAHDKDKVEDATQAAICAGLPGYEHTKYKKTSLKEAQTKFGADWVAWGHEIGALQ